MPLFLRTFGDGHLGQLLPPLWQLLTDGRERHEQSMLSGNGGGEDGDEDGDGGDNEGGGGMCWVLLLAWRGGGAPAEGVCV